MSFELQTAPWHEQTKVWPSSGRHIMAQYDASTVIVYQAYAEPIGLFAAEHGYFGGAFSYGRMSWIKPNFLWMMFRSGWGSKEGQQVVLAVRLKRPFFDELLRQAVHSSYVAEVYGDRQTWQKAVARSDVRLQWDPDHGPGGNKLERRAIQLGLRGDVLREYGREAIVDITDVSEFVREQSARDRDALVTPLEAPYPPPDAASAARLGVAS